VPLDIASGGAMSELDLAQEELRELATAVIAAAGNPSEPFGQYVFRPDEPEAELARHVEGVVFGEWFGNSRKLLDSEYRPYDDSTVFLAILDHRRRLPAGMARMTLPSPTGFKTLHDIEAVWGRPLADVLGETGLEWDLGRVWDVLTIAVMNDYRGKATEGLLTLSILQFGSQGLLHTGGRYSITVLDLVVLDLVQSMIGQPYQRFPGIEPIRYLDSPASIPVFADFEEWMPRLAAADKTMHDLLFVEPGIEAVLRGPSWDRVLAVAGLDRSARDQDAGGVTR
jgi:hypothetical protein